MSERYEGLDSLRGLAAVTVVLCHLALALPYFEIIEKFKYTPLKILWAGHEAVILFFVLSGFVLSLSFINNKTLPFKHFLIKRICRIYLPYVCSIFIAFALMFLFSYTNNEQLSGWFNQPWTSPISMEMIINHIILLGQFGTGEVNTVIWSLVHEMRISILFPFLMILIVKFNWKKNLIIALSCSIMYFLIYYFSLKVLHYDVAVYMGSYASTIHYTSFFILGALLAMNMEHLRKLYNKLTTIVKFSLLLFALLIYTYKWWFFTGVSILHLEPVNDWAIAIGVVIFIVFALNSNLVKRVLQIKLISFTGKISYSLYLYHLLVGFTLFKVFYGKIPTSILMIGVFILSIIIAAIMYYAVEKPAIKLGRLLTRKKTVNLKVPAGTISETPQPAK